MNEDDEWGQRRSKSYGTLDDTAALETASYTAKMHVEVNSLQRVSDSYFGKVLICYMYLCVFRHGQLLADCLRMTGLSG